MHAHVPHTHQHLTATQSGTLQPCPGISPSACHIHVQKTGYKPVQREIRKDSKGRFTLLNMAVPFSNNIMASHPQAYMFPAQHHAMPSPHRAPLLRQHHGAPALTRQALGAAASGRALDGMGHIVQGVDER